MTQSCNECLTSECEPLQNSDSPFIPLRCISLTSYPYFRILLSFSFQTFALTLKQILFIDTQNTVIKTVPTFPGEEKKTAGSSL